MSFAVCEGMQKPKSSLKIRISINCDMFNKKLRKINDLYHLIFDNEISAQYVGWVGHQNLGDEVIKEACNGLYAPLRMNSLSKTKYTLINKILNKRRMKGVILGGGTLIGHKSPIDQVEYGLSTYGCGIIIGAGVEPVVHDKAPNWLINWKKILQRCEYVGVRSEESAAVLKRVGVDAIVTGDTALYFGEKTDFWTPQPKLIGVNIGQSFGHVYGTEDSISDSYSKLINLLMKDGWFVEFFCVSPCDERIVYETAIKSGIANPCIHKIYDGANKYKKIVKRMSLFIGMKLHSVVLANCACVPAVMIEYRPKCYEYMKSIGMAGYVIRSDEIEVNKIIEMVNEMYSNKYTLSCEISNKIQEYKSALIAFSTASKRCLS